MNSLIEAFNREMGESMPDIFQAEQKIYSIDDPILDHVIDFPADEMSEEEFADWSEGVRDWDGLLSVEHGARFGGNLFAKIGEWPDLETVTVDE